MTVLAADMAWLCVGLCCSLTLLFVVVPGFVVVFRLLRRKWAWSGLTLCRFTGYMYFSARRGCCRRRGQFHLLLLLLLLPMSSHVRIHRLWLWLIVWHA